MIDAIKARQQIDDMHNKTGEALRQRAEQAITNAVSEGLSRVSLTVPYSHVKPMTKWLEDLGYRVNSGDCQREGSWFNVNW